MKERIFPKTKIDLVWKEWQSPRHDEYQERNVWSWFNAVTEIIKPPQDRQHGNRHYLFDLPARTTRLHTLCDAVADVKIEKN
jgi:hypothetical protein